jgi:hypothetical protein
MSAKNGDMWRRSRLSPKHLFWVSDYGERA